MSKSTSEKLEHRNSKTKSVSSSSNKENTKSNSKINKDKLDLSGELDSNEMRDNYNDKLIYDKNALVNSENNNKDKDRDSKY